MSSDRFDFQQFSIQQDRCAMKVGIDAVLLGVAFEPPAFCYHALDIGTGSGILALMIAQRVPTADVDAIDLNTDAAAQAGENAASSPFAERVAVYQGRVQDFRPKTTYDLIICNPPYFTDGVPSPDAARQQARSTESLSHRELLSAVNRLLNPTGVFWTILPFDQSSAFVSTANDFYLKPSKQLRVKPRPQLSPNRTVLQFERVGKRVAVDELSVRDESGQTFSSAFTALTRDFYLP